MILVHNGRHTATGGGATTSITLDRFNQPMDNMSILVSSNLISITNVVIKWYINGHKYAEQTVAGTPVWTFSGNISHALAPTNPIPDKAGMYTNKNAKLYDPYDITITFTLTDAAAKDFRVIAIGTPEPLHL